MTDPGFSREWGANHKAGHTNQLFWKVSPKNYTKMNKLGPRNGDVPGSANDIVPLKRGSNLNEEKYFSTLSQEIGDPVFCGQIMH